MDLHEDFWRVPTVDEISHLHLSTPPLILMEVTKQNFRVKIKQLVGYGVCGNASGVLCAAFGVSPRRLS